MERKKSVKNFKPMTLTGLLLLFHKTHLNLLNYERKPPDNHINIEKADSAGCGGDPASR